MSTRSEAIDLFQPWRIIHAETGWNMAASRNEIATGMTTTVTWLSSQNTPATAAAMISSRQDQDAPTVRDRGT